MAGPWTQYQPQAQPAPAAPGPWTQYQPAAPAAPAAPGPQEAPQAPQAAPQAPQATPPTPAPSWSEVPGQAFVNAPKSLGQLVGGLYEAVTSPVQTVKAAGDVLAGALRAAVPENVRNFIDRFDNPETTKRISEAASAAGGMLKERYGSEEALRRTIATDPVGFAADASMLLTGGGSAAARGGSFVQRVAPTGGAIARAGERVADIGETAAKLGQAVDPITASARGVALAGKGAGAIAAPVAGMVTGQGGKAVREAAESGFEGGRRGAAFREQMRGGDAAAAVAEARDALQNMRQQRSAEYMSNRALWGNDPTVLNFGNIDRAVLNAENLFTFKGVPKDLKAADVYEQIKAAVNEWRKLDPAEYHNAAGLDALKQRVGGIIESIPQEQRAARAVGTQVYRSIWNEIQQQAPSYARSMKAFEDASKQIEEITKTLSTGKGSIDTELRKLQSIMRNNVNTNWGQREKLVEALQKAGATEIMPMLAGQSSSSWTPRGIQGALGGAAGLGALATNPMLLPYLALSSPRLMGEVVHAGGRVAGGAQRLADVLGRTPYTPSVGQAARYGAAVQRYQNQEQTP